MFAPSPSEVTQRCVHLHLAHLLLFRSHPSALFGQRGDMLQCLCVPLSDMQSNFGIVMLACLLLRTLQQARADPFAAPIAEHSERIDIPFIVLRLPFEPASNGGVEPCLISTPKAQNQPDHL